MIKERCYFMGGVADDYVYPVSPKKKIVMVPNYYRACTYTRTLLTHPAHHPLHGEWPLTVYVWTK